MRGLTSCRAFLGGEREGIVLDITRKREYKYYVFNGGIQRITFVYWIGDQIMSIKLRFCDQPVPLRTRNAEPSPSDLALQFVERLKRDLAAGDPDAIWRG
jgi:hypothetical protein